MYSLNTIHLIGHVADAPELRQLPSGTSVLDLNIRCVSRVKKEDGETIVLTSYHTVTLWRKIAEIAGDYCQLGSQVFIKGRIKTDQWETPEGQKRFKTKIIGEDLILLDSRKEVATLGEDSPLFGGENVVSVLGNMTKEAELRQTPNGDHVANFSVATNRRWQDRDSGEQKEETEFHNVVAWGALAQEIAEKIQKGQRTYVQGRLQTRSWETPDGEKRYTTEIVAEKVLLLGARDEGLATGGGGATAAAGAAATTAAAGGAKAQGEAKNPDDDLPVIQYESDIKPEDLPF